MVNGTQGDSHDLPSRSAVRKAGSTIRGHFRNSEIDVDDDRSPLIRAANVVRAYRSQFSEPMGRIDQGLRNICDQIGAYAQVSYRLKRLPTIINKLARLDNMDLSRMEDVGGCRIVTADYGSLMVLHNFILKEYAAAIHRERDYVSTPRISGYRAIHVVIHEPQSNLKIEVQLRTTSMHDWAELVESFSRVLVDDFKYDGSHPVQEFMKLQSKQFAFVEGHGPQLSSAELDRMRTLGQDVRERLNSMGVPRERT